VQSRRIAESFEGLDRSLAQTTGELMDLQSDVKLVAQCMFRSTIYSYTSSEHVKKQHVTLVVPFIICYTNDFSAHFTIGKCYFKQNMIS